MDEDNKPSITPSENGPYIVKGLESLANRHGAVETKETMALCRCGGSANKPFCDGTHLKNGFSSAKLEGRVTDRRENYQGAKITIHDNRGICAHAGRCTDGLPAVFHLNEEPWIHPTSPSAEEIIDTINKCPSGALSYSVDGVEHANREGDPSIFIAPNGPYVVSGGPDLEQTTRGEGASKEHFTMCRCGGSKNKPFCDGSHWHNGFKDDKN
ncbi:CDGSH iron-sulfur domain-containing protein [Reichenbachiella sp.]|uniref:CDGSH iron-sulfur domain-containing protein n=1 Tax=Reichenbachiella sp. TaxID=2184521 RepID=UPI003298BAC6